MQKVSFFVTHFPDPISKQGRSIWTKFWVIGIKKMLCVMKEKYQICHPSQFSMGTGTRISLCPKLGFFVVAKVPNFGSWDMPQLTHIVTNWKIQVQMISRISRKWWEQHKNSVFHFWQVRGMVRMLYSLCTILFCKNMKTELMTLKNVTEHSNSFPPLTVRSNERWIWSTKEEYLKCHIV